MYQERKFYMVRFVCNTNKYIIGIATECYGSYGVMDSLTVVLH